VGKHAEIFFVPTTEYSVYLVVIIFKQEDYLGRLCATGLAQFFDRDYTKRDALLTANLSPFVLSIQLLLETQAAV
jgi:hypothetical protein